MIHITRDSASCSWVSKNNSTEMSFKVLLQLTPLLLLSIINVHMCSPIYKGHLMTWHRPFLNPKPCKAVCLVNVIIWFNPSENEATKQKGYALCGTNRTLHSTSWRQPCTLVMGYIPEIIFICHCQNINIEYIIIFLMVIIKLQQNIAKVNIRQLFVTHKLYQKTILQIF